jgi:hypothetical protein
MHRIEPNRNQISGVKAMASVYDKDAFSDRVNYAAKCFLRGTSGTRHFDTCFEMNDGDAVVTALVRRAERNAKLHAAIARQWSGTFPKSWRDTAEKYEHIPTLDLKKLAMKQREDARAAFEKRFLEKA